MPLLKRAILAALLLCLPCAAGAAEPSHWASDPASGCALFDASQRPGDTVRWSGDCKDGRADGSGTATFLSDGKVFESFTGTFADGVAADGSVTVSWGDGWSYDGEMEHGRFDGEGILVNDKRDHFEGLWSGGKLNGMGSVIHADGERYDGVWKNDLPNGHGILTRADGSKLEGEFLDGKFAADAVAAMPASINSAAAKDTPTPEKDAPSLALSGLTGKKLLAVDGAVLNLTPIEGGIERDISAAGGTLEKTTFTFINERLGTVAADAGAGGANVTGFFRLTDNGVEVRYADGRGEILSANTDGGVTLRLETPGAAAACRSFYPAGHSFSEAEKRAAVAEYASRLGLGDAKPGCPGDAAAAIPVPNIKPRAEAKSDLRHPSKFVEPKFPTSSAGAKRQLAALEPVTVKDSVVHAIDAMPNLPTAPMSGPPMAEAAAASAATPEKASQCLKVESDGYHWGFRNACGFDVQFAYCLAQGGDSLTGCAGGGVPGSVAAGSFGALLADKSFSETDAEHAFRWLACGGGAGEVVARLDHADPPEGRCLTAGSLGAGDVARNDTSDTAAQGDRK